MFRSNPTYVEWTFPKPILILIWLLGYHSNFFPSLLQTWIQNIYAPTFPNSLYIILHIRDLTVDTYSIFHFHRPKSMENVSSVHLSTECINVVLVIMPNIFIARSYAPFWCEAPAPLNLFFFWVCNSSSANSEVLDIPLSVWYPLITTPWILSSHFNNTLYRVWWTSIEMEKNQ